MDENNGVAAGAAPLPPVQSSPSAMTNAQIVAMQAEARAFRATETGGLLQRFTSAHGTAWRTDSNEHVSDKRLRDVWDASNAAEALLIASIKKLQVSVAGFDANVDRLKACEHIADGDDGWESLRNERPSTAAVARLQDRFAAVTEALLQIKRDNQQYNFGSKLVRIVDVAIAKAEGWS